MAFQDVAYQEDAFQCFGLPKADGADRVGSYRRPIIYVDKDGKPVKLDQPRKADNDRLPAQPPALPKPASPAVIQAMISAALMKVEAERVAAAEAEQLRLMQEHDDMAIALLLLS